MLEAVRLRGPYRQTDNIVFYEADIMKFKIKWPKASKMDQTKSSNCNRNATDCRNNVCDL